MAQNADLSAVAEEIDRAQQLFKLVFASECCRKLSEWYDKDEIEGCRGCRDYDSDKLGHECMGYGAHVPFKASSFCDHEWMHEAIFKVDEERIRIYFLKAMYKERFRDPTALITLLSHWWLKIQGQWFGELYNIIKDGKVNEKSCMYPEIELPRFDGPTVTMTSLVVEIPTNIKDEQGDDGVSTTFEEGRKLVFARKRKFGEALDSDDEAVNLLV